MKNDLLYNMQVQHLSSLKIWHSTMQCTVAMTIHKDVNTQYE